MTKTIGKYRLGETVAVLGSADPAAHYVDPARFETWVASGILAEAKTKKPGPAEERK